MNPAQSRRLRIERMADAADVNGLSAALETAERHCGLAHQREVRQALTRARRMRDSIANRGTILDQIGQP